MLRHSINSMCRFSSLHVSASYGGAHVAFRYGIMCVHQPQCFPPVKVLDLGSLSACCCVTFDDALLKRVFSLLVRKYKEL